MLILYEHNYVSDCVTVDYSAGRIHTRQLLRESSQFQIEHNSLKPDRSATAMPFSKVFQTLKKMTKHPSNTESSEDRNNNNNNNNNSASSAESQGKELKEGVGCADQSSSNYAEISSSPARSQMKGIHYVQFGKTHSSSTIELAVEKKKALAQRWRKIICLKRQDENGLQWI